MSLNRFDGWLKVLSESPYGNSASSSNYSETFNILAESGLALITEASENIITEEG